MRIGTETIGRISRRFRGETRSAISAFDSVPLHENRQQTSHSHSRDQELNVTDIMASYSDRMENMFQCSVCQDMPSCKIYQCRGGHLTCHECHSMLQRPILCPVCRDPMPATPIRNRAAEEVVLQTFVLYIEPF